MGWMYTVEMHVIQLPKHFLSLLHGTRYIPYMQFYAANYLPVYWVSWFLFSISHNHTTESRLQHHIVGADGCIFSWQAHWQTLVHNGIVNSVGW